MTQKISSVNIETATLSSFTGPTISSVAIANSTYVILDDTAVSNAGGYAVITGTNFVSGAQVLFGSTSATAVTFVNSTTLNVQVPALTAGSYVMYVQNPDGSTAIRLNGITSSPIPVWATGSTLTNQDVDTPFTISLSASSDSSVTYAVSNGSSLPSGTTLASNGLFSGTVTGISNETTYNFNVDAIDAENQETLRSFSVTVTSGDQYYKNTVLHFNGEISSNAWITDASTNKLAVTVSGDTKPSGFSPYETVWSNFFDGSGDYLTVPNNTALQMGTGDFTIEFWIYYNSITNYQTPFSKGYTAAGDLLLQTGLSNGVMTVWFSGTAVITEASGASVGQWYHYALVRSGTTVTLYRNGVSRGTATSSVNFNTTDQLGIGSTGKAPAGESVGTFPINGYMSNVRVVKGTAVYTSAFTPSTSPLTAIANTSLLTCQSNRLRDASTNNFTITKNGDVTVSNFGPFVKTDLVTGSGYFDGAGDYLTVADDTSLDGFGDFTIECWVYWPSTTAGTFQVIFDKGWNSNSYGAYLITLQSGALRFYMSFDGSSWGVDSGNLLSPGINQWYHIAISRSGSSGRIFVNGTQLYTFTNSTTVVNSSLGLGIGGTFGGQYPLNGYISDVRIVKGTAVYTTSFTPPTSPLTAIANTSLLTLQSRIGENNNRFVDASGINNLITRNGNATQGTFSPFAVTGWSNYFDGSGDYLSLPSSTAFGLGTGSFTFECWLYPTANPANGPGTIFDARSGVAAEGYVIRAFNDGTVGIYTSSGAYVYSTGTITLNAWNHVALVRSSTGTNGLAFYINGVASGTATVSQDLGTTWAPLIGWNRAGTGYEWNGYISNLRLLKGTALYTTNFTPPTSPLTAIANTSLLTCQSNRFIDNSTNNFAITRNGDVSVQPFSPFKPTNSWSPTTVGGSMILDGTGDFLTIPNNAALNPGTQDFVMEAWVYIRALTGANQGFNGKGTAGTDGYSFYVTNGLVLSFIWNGTGGATITAGTLKLNAWHHVAVVRNSGVIRLYLDGVGAGSSTSCTTDITTTGVKYVGQARGGNPVNGYMAGYRMIKGQLPTEYDATASTITVPTAPFESLKSTSLLLNGTSGGIIDYTGKNNLETLGDAKTRNNIVKYDNTSIYFDGTDDYLLIPANPNLEFGSGDFTIEFWWYPTSTTRQALYHGSFGTDWSIGIDYSSTSTNQKIGIWASSNGTSWNLINADAGGNGIGTTTITQNAWNHIAYVRNGTTWMLFVNGNRDLNLTGISGSIINRSTSSKVIGTWWNTTAMSEVFGYIDDFRITKGVARYTANFTPPTSAFKTK